jgi:programmed cell death protein 5
LSDYGSDYDPELEEIKRRQLARVQQRFSAQDVEDQRAAIEAEEARRQAILRQALTTEARQRLQNVKMVKPSIARLLEDQIIALFQSGKLDRPITDGALKQLLLRISMSNSRETNITIRRKGEM